MNDVTIDSQAIARLTREIQREFDKHPIRVPIQTGQPVLPCGARIHGAATTVYHGPVIYGNGGQRAVGLGKRHCPSNSSSTGNRHWIRGHRAGGRQDNGEVCQTVGLDEDDLQGRRSRRRCPLGGYTSRARSQEDSPGDIQSKGYLAPVAAGLEQVPPLVHRSRARTAIDRPRSRPLKLGPPGPAALSQDEIRESKGYVVT